MGHWVLKKLYWDHLNFFPKFYFGDECDSDERGNMNVKWMHEEGEMGREN